MNETGDAPSQFVFPRWANYLLPAAIVFLLGGGLYMPVLLGMAGNPKTLNVGYQPEQPVPYSHELHAGEMGMDCRYCHNTVEDAAFAAIPPTQTCINCHTPTGQDGQGNALTGLMVHAESTKLEPVHESFASGEPIEWTKVHDLADYVYFNHSAHVNHGVGCYSCHGRVDKMGEAGVYQVEDLSMAWCLDCHRNPQQHLRPMEQVTNMSYHLGTDPANGGGPDGLQTREGETLAEAQLRVGNRLMNEYNIHSRQYMQACSTCHR